MTVELLTVDDVARITGLSVYTVRAAVRDCELIASKLRGRIRVHPDDLAAWVDASRVRPAGTLTRGAMPAPRPRTTPPAGGYRQAARARRRAA